MTCNEKSKGRIDRVNEWKHPIERMYEWMNDWNNILTGRQIYWQWYIYIYIYIYRERERDREREREREREI
jgi:hypothetical protein